MVQIAALLPTLIKVLPGAINTVVSLVKDKKAKKELTEAPKLDLKELKDEVLEIPTGEAPNTEVVHKDIASGVSLSSTRLMNVLGTPSLLMYGVHLVDGGKSKEGLIVIGLAVLLTIGLSVISYLKDKA